VHEAGLADRIHFHFHGRVPPGQVQPLLQRSQATLLMSYFEGLLVALLEAMAAGVVPVVRAIESGIPELVQHEHTELLVGNDPAEAAAALVRLSQDQTLWERFSNQAGALVKASYSGELYFVHWCGLIEQQRGAARPTFPIRTSDLRRLLPLADPRFQSHYPSAPNRWSRRQGRLRRFAARLA
jgi:colanic acid/amylovoran biosynthesis glycosyltransferase